MNIEPIARKVTPEIVQGIHRMTIEGLTKREMSEVLGISTDLIKRIRSGRYTCMDAATSTLCKELFGDANTPSSANPPGIEAAGDDGAPVTAVQACKRPQSGYFAARQKKLAPVGSYPTEAVPEAPKPTETPEKEIMLLPKQTLSDAARKQFSLFTNPFDGEVTTDAEMFMNGEIRFVHETSWQAAVGGRMVAVIGESGAGKTTMLDDLKEKILREHRPVVCIEPSVEGMEESDTKGKSIKSAEIHAAIVLTLDSNASVAQSSEKRSRQVKRMLEESVQSGRSHLLIIEEAHALPVSTLNHLKRLHEKMRLGRRPMLGILLVGHPELEKKLSRYDVREVMQRTEIARLRPLGADLSTYMQLRASAVGRKLEEFITPEGVDELRSRLTVKSSGQDATVSLLYPLNVNNWMVAALNTAAALGAPRIDRDVIREV